MHEAAEQERLDRARVVREAEKQRVAELLAIEVERERMRAKNLEDQRKVMREEAEKWNVKQEYSDDDDDKKTKGKKRKAKPKNRDGSIASEDEDDEKPKKRVSRPGITALLSSSLCELIRSFH